jgi:sugar lactone lactonase YvrE
VSSNTGLITTVTGTGDPGFNGDDILATAAQLHYPNCIVFDIPGNMYIADTNNHRIRQVSARTGIITTIAGTGDNGFNGDDMLATTAQLSYPRAIAVDNYWDASFGSIFIADTFNHRICYVGARSGLIKTVAGTGAFGFNGDYIPATTAHLWYPSGIASHVFGDIFVTDTSNHRIREVSANTGLITTVAGTGAPGFNGDDILATAAQLNFPNDVVLSNGGAARRNIYIADAYNHRIRHVSADTGIITTIAGTGDNGFNGDDIPATTAQLSYPSKIAVGASGNAFIADTYNHRIRQVSKSSLLITTLAGIDVPSSSPSAAPSDEPTALPTAAPSVEPTSLPTAAPSAVPSVEPTSLPTAAPSVAPTSLPTAAPSAVPSVDPSAFSSAASSRRISPTRRPTSPPTVKPSQVPTTAPTRRPTQPPTVKPTRTPTLPPTVRPSPQKRPALAPASAFKIQSLSISSLFQTIVVRPLTSLDSKRTPPELSTNKLPSTT